jgi:P pilus assembly chaperone PapD
MKKTLLATALLVLSMPAMALKISPVTTTYTGKQPSGTFVVTNISQQHENYEVIVSKLVSENGVEVQKPSDELILPQRTISLEPGQSQTVRYLRAKPFLGNEEIFVATVQQIIEGPSLAPKKVMPILFIWREPNATPSLSARWDGNALLVTNSGSASAVLSRLTAGSKTRNGMLGGVLAGTTKRFILPGFPHVNVSVDVDGKRQELSTQ